MLSDLRFALRSLAQSPGFTAVSILTLALGIGATTAIFSIVNAVVLRPLAYHQPGELVAVRSVIPAVIRDYPTLPVNARFYTEWKAAPAFSELAVIDRGRATLTGTGDPLRLEAVYASVNLLATLGVRPALGRDFTAGEDVPDQPGVVIISDRLWQMRFGGDPAVIGRTVTLNLRPLTVIGVLPAGFHLPGLGSVTTPDVYYPNAFKPDELAEIIGRFNYEVIGRLAPGITREAAEAQINVIADRLSKLAGEKTEVRGLLQPLQEAVTGQARRGLWILLGAVGVVLALACFNLAILGLARAERNRHPSAVRAALGASRQRLFAQSIAESLVLSLAGGALGGLLAWWLLDVLVRLAPGDLPRIQQVSIDPVVLAFALGATLVTAMLAGSIPAWFQARRDASSELLAAGGMRLTGNRQARRLRAAFVAVEIAVSTVLLAAAALLVGSFARVLRADVGFNAPAVLTSSLNIPTTRYQQPADKLGYYDRVLASLAATPGVESAAVTNRLPLRGQTWIDSVHAEGDTRPTAEQPQTNVRFVSSDYFATLGIPLLAGRSFRADDPTDAVILSARLAETLWPGQDPMGRTLQRGVHQKFRVIGVAGDTRTNVDQPAVSVMYRVMKSWPMSEMALAVRLDRAQPAPVSAIQQAIRLIDPEVPLQPLRPMAEAFSDALAARRFQMQLVAAFAFSALALAALGIYGVVAQGVGQRTRELGIRLAFGAPPAALARMILGQAFRPIAVGLVVGLAVALAGGRLLASFLYDTSPHDPLALAVVTAGLLLTATLACLIPARRATRINPIAALRAD